MERIKETFERTRQQGRIALMPYLPVGYPDVETTVALAPALVAAGADLFELGVPYSDPQADGPTIQRATHRALQNGVTLRICLEVAARIRSSVDVPITLMGYYNPIARFGNAAFCQAAKAAGVDGLIVPDMPPEEADDLKGPARECQLDIAFLVAPTSTEERLRIVTAAASGFVYCVSLAGVTGARSHLAMGLPEYLQRVRDVTTLPLAVGFGISRPEHVREVARYADGAIVASALVDRINTLPADEQIAGAAAFIGELAEATART